jgi:hypothetical protein
MGSILNLAGDATVADAAAEMMRQDAADGKPLTRIVGAKVTVKTETVDFGTVAAALLCCS